MSAAVSSSPDIPDEAVEAARKAFTQYEEQPVRARGFEDDIRAALAAAYPALTRQAAEDERAGLYAKAEEIRDAAVAAERDRIAAADDAITVPKSDVYDPKGYLWRDQWKWAVERAEKAEARLADVWDEGAMDERWNSEHEGSIERGTRQRITNPYRAELETTP